MTDEEFFRAHYRRQKTVKSVEDTLKFLGVMIVVLVGVALLFAAISADVDCRNSHCPPGQHPASVDSYDHILPQCACVLDR